jgi:hypothetical protein
MILFFIISFVMFFRVFYSGQTYPIDVGNVTAIFNRFACIQIPNNSKQSFKTFISVDALAMGIIGSIGNVGALFMDQSFWQFNSTASPKKSPLAFVAAGFIWFFVRLLTLIKYIFFSFFVNFL